MLCLYLHPLHYEHQEVFKVVAFMAIAFYFLIFKPQTERSRIHKLVMLQHLKRSKWKRMGLLKIALKNMG